MRFPRCNNLQVFADDAGDIRTQFPNAKGKNLVVVSVHLPDDTAVVVEGHGIPFANPKDPEVEGWVNHNKPICGNYSLLDLFQQRDFYFATAQRPQEVLKALSDDQLGEPFSYPYGTDHSWNADRYKALIKANQGEKFLPTYR